MAEETEWIGDNTHVGITEPATETVLHARLRFHNEWVMVRRWKNTRTRAWTVEKKALGLVRTKHRHEFLSLFFRYCTLSTFCAPESWNTSKGLRNIALEEFFFHIRTRLLRRSVITREWIIAWRIISTIYVDAFKKKRVMYLYITFGSRTKTRKFIKSLESLNLPSELTTRLFLSMIYPFSAKIFDFSCSRSIKGSTFGKFDPCRFRTSVERLEGDGKNGSSSRNLWIFI